MSAPADRSDIDEFDALVYRPEPVNDDWPAIESELTRAYRLTQAAAREGRAVVYVLDTDHLLGRAGSGPAIVATGLLSAARTAAIELARAGVPVNVLAIGEDADPEMVATWTRALATNPGPTGEIVHLGPSHIGKALQ